MTGAGSRGDPDADAGAGADAEPEAEREGEGAVPTGPLVVGRRVLLRRPVEADCDEFVAAVRRSRALHHPWVTAPGTAVAFQAWIDRQRDPGFRALLLVERATGSAAGVFNLSQIVHGPFCSAYLGYYALAGHEGRGLMRAGLRLVLRHAFGALGLHRIEANIQPGNLPSIALVRSCGFALEGYSPRYLKIGGRWRDHERWAVRSDGRRPSTRPVAGVPGGPSIDPAGGGADPGLA